MKQKFISIKIQKKNYKTTEHYFINLIEFLNELFFL